MSNIIIEIDKSLTSSNNSEPMTATKSSSSTTSDSDAGTSTIPKAFSCSACSLQAYHLWVILRHIRNVHQNDGSNAKIIDNINNQIIEDNDDLKSDISVNHKTTSDINEQDEMKNVNNEEMLKHLINTAMATRKTNASNTFLENLPANLMNNNVAASLATLLGQLTNKQLLQQQQQQQFQSEKVPLAKRYKCSLCSHISAWGGEIYKVQLKIINFNSRQC
jgi:signal recognition particle GTPase